MRKLMITLIAVVIALAGSTPSAFATTTKPIMFYNSEANVYLNQKQLTLTPKATLDRNGVFQVPVSLITQLTGNRVTINSSDKSAVFTVNGTAHKLTVNSNLWQAGSQSIPMDTPLIEKKGTYMVSLNTLCKVLNYDYDFSYLMGERELKYGSGVHNLYLKKLTASDKSDSGAAAVGFDKVHFTAEGLKSIGGLENVKFYENSSTPAKIMVTPTEMSIGYGNIISTYYHPKIMVSYERPGAIRLTFGKPLYETNRVFPYLINDTRLLPEDIAFVKAALTYALGDEGRRIADLYLPHMADLNDMNVILGVGKYKASTVDENQYYFSQGLIITFEEAAFREAVTVYYKDQKIAFDQITPFKDSDGTIWLPEQLMQQIMAGSSIAWHLKEIDGSKYIAYDDFAKQSGKNLDVSYGYDMRSMFDQGVASRYFSRDMKQTRTPLTYDLTTITHRALNSDRIEFYIEDWHNSEKEQLYLTNFMKWYFADRGNTATTLILEALNSGNLSDLDGKRFALSNDLSVVFDAKNAKGSALKISVLFNDNLAKAHVIDIDQMDPYAIKTPIQLGYSKFKFTEDQILKANAFKHFFIDNKHSYREIYSGFKPNTIGFTRLNNSYSVNPSFEEISIGYPKKGELQIIFSENSDGTLTQSPYAFIDAGLKFFMGADGKKIANQINLDLKSCQLSYKWLNQWILPNKTYKIGNYTISYENTLYSKGNENYGSKYRKTIKIQFKEK